jgi:poly-gamma-glutamate synthesis protein (capsule biosynthesis protein)
MHRRIAVPAALALAAVFAVRAGAAQQQPRPLGAYGGERAFSIALAGDAVITRRLSSHEEPRFLQLLERIRGADLAFANLEMLFHDYEPSPEAQSGNLGAYLRADPAMAQELAWAGLDLVSMANDHVGDYGAEGMRLTRSYAEDAGLLTAGTGEDLREAREARFLETHDGRVALISTAATFTAHSRAGPPRGGVRGRPGLSALRIANQGPRPIEASALERLRTTLQGMGVEVTPAGQPLNAFGVQLAAGDEGSQAGVPNETDLREISAVVRNADGLSDYVVLSVHAHNQGAYLQAFARAMVDAGADVIVGHGPHSLRGIEIYQGKPIFYSLGDFIFQDETILRLPADSYTRYGLGADATVADFNAARAGTTETSDYESVVAIPTFESGRLVSIELHPITLGAGEAPATKGRPMLAEPEQGRRIIQRLTEMSRRYGTVIEWQEDRGIGVVRVPSAEQM